MNNLRKLREKKNLSQEALAGLLNISQGTLSHWERGRNDIDLKSLKKISDIFGVTIDEILGNITLNTSAVELKRFPVLGELAAGEPLVMNTEYETYVDADTAFRADFCLRVRGNSMINAGIKDGDIVFIKEQPDVMDGEIAAVAIDDEATLKRVFKYKDHIVLQAESPYYKPIVIFADDTRDIRILGKAVAIQSLIY